MQFLVFPWPLIVLQCVSVCNIHSIDFYNIVFFSYEYCILAFLVFEKSKVSIKKGEFFVNDLC